MWAMILYRNLKVVAAESGHGGSGVIAKKDCGSFSSHDAFVGASDRSQCYFCMVCLKSFPVKLVLALCTILVPKEMGCVCKSQSKYSSSVLIVLTTAEETGFDRVCEEDPRAVQSPR